MIDDFLNKMVEAKASDLFVTAGVAVAIKVNGKLATISEESLTPERSHQIVLSLMNEKQQQEFLETKELNFAIFKPELGRFRVSAYQQRNYTAAVLRRIEAVIPTLKELQVPKEIADFAMLKRGLVLVVGATGSGKSSTLAAMIGHRNRNSSGHIITVEDPIEFVHEHKQSVISQREIGIDTESYEMALKNTLRQAPDVILIGEVRSRETLQHAIAFAETGHLCLTTLHANNANQALDRIINFFPSNMHNQILLDLSLNLRAIVAQQLIPTVDGNGRRAAIEILINTPIISDHIRKGAVDELKEYMTKGREQGMQTFDQALFKLHKEGVISYDDALLHADSNNELRLMIKLSEGNVGQDSGGLSITDSPDIK